MNYGISRNCGITTNSGMMGNYGIIGDPKEKIYWWPSCKDYPEKREEYVIFGYKRLAESMGYHSSSECDQ